ncbi:2,3-bisphosphoglycerate-independent phosphoglycerate mutase [Candidatus Venteria ishoeyi]|uniref:2,3-bisphosphoglycerate-independent phosphoglycerate mutase n=1 Tax=Candidatus Venteria ishoeyi TaxID=1899563 RepID=A0A1H6FGH5_9GAMM|nr:2,3-bisphosphoglycerate-independent phosphoglycerate mutase [Candidatus Venteria ishoeyi]MDM8545223.1 2,3-bisphosphoglycerate-independent phosphoglycerate mutase [Candidatus Venteria ishoeyi]SEH08135.1 2%2C3-bisphosphoglycerate-independent phosphoglycerate mutase [Candidatus Venteria ishoeyi]
MKPTCRPLTLIIMDGWGYSEQAEYNAIAQANTPVWDQLWESNPHAFLDASGFAVGLPEGQMGNSEVGHLNLGSGRVVYQDFSRIGQEIKNQRFKQNPVLQQAVKAATEQGKAVHIMGLLSPGGVHSHEDHLFAMLELAVQQGAEKLYLHAFLDGRDTPPRSASNSVKRAEELFKRLGTGRIASLVGRYYVMDRDKRWDRVQQAYNLLTCGIAHYHADTAQEALAQAYARHENDEFVKPSLVGETVRIADGDAVVFMNFRADRAREISRCFLEQDFKGFERQCQPKLSQFVSLTQYQKSLDCAVAYPPEQLPQVLGEVLSNAGMRQLRIAETEKYAHVTFFFNGGEETVYPGEDRVLIPSPKVATYDLQPEMSAIEVTDHLVAAIERIHSQPDQAYDAIICNFANTDMVGHTGNIDAGIKAVETIDHCLSRILKASAKVGGEMLITADHGNAEKMFDPDSEQMHTAHTSNLVPFVYVGPRQTEVKSGALSDVAPTILTLMGMDIPAVMTGHSLVSLIKAAKE